MPNWSQESCCKASQGSDEPGEDPEVGEREPPGLSELPRGISGAPSSAFSGSVDMTEP